MSLCCKIFVLTLLAMATMAIWNDPTSDCVTMMVRYPAKVTWKIRHFTILQNNSQTYTESNRLQVPHGLHRDVQNNWQMSPSLYFHPYTENTYDSGRHISVTKTSIVLNAQLSPINEPPFKSPNSISVATLDEKGEKFISGKMQLIRNDNHMQIWNFQSNMLTVEALHANEKLFLPDDTLTLQFEIIQENALHMLNQGDYIDKPPEKSPDFWLFRQNDQYVDVDLQLDNGHKIAAHKIILAAKSPVLQSMINANQSLVLANTTKSVAMDFVRFLYTGEDRFNVTDADKLLLVADRFQVDDLKRMCEQLLVSQLTPETAAKTLILANKVNTNFLKSATLDFVVRNFNDVSSSPAWRKAIKSHPEITMDSMAALFNKLGQI